jgi:hypothetical protein
MTTRTTLATAVAALCLLAGTSPLPAADTPAKAKPVLQAGMDADTIIQLYGKPVEIQPMDNKAGLKAEKWIYRRKAREYTAQDASDIAMIPAFIGNTGTGSQMIADVPTLEFRVKFITVYQVTALLMVEGKLTIGKQWLEREERFTN